MHATLERTLSEWSEFDVTMHAIATSLGLVQKEDWFSLKKIYWSQNEVSGRLAEIMKSLTEIGAIEYDETEGKWRWNREFRIIRNEN